MITKWCANKHKPIALHIIMGYFSQDPRMDFSKNSDSTLWNKKATTAWIQYVKKKIKNMIKNIFDYKKTEQTHLYG